MADKIAPKPRPTRPPAPPPASKSRSKNTFRKPTSSPSPSRSGSRAGEFRPSGNFGSSRRYTASPGASGGSGFQGRPAGGYRPQTQFGSGFQRPPFQGGAFQRPQQFSSSQRPAFPSAPPQQGFMPTPFNSGRPGQFRPGMTGMPNGGGLPVGVPLPNAGGASLPGRPVPRPDGTPLTPTYPMGTGGTGATGLPPAASGQGRPLPPAGTFRPQLQTGSTGFNGPPNPGLSTGRPPDGRPGAVPRMDGRPPVPTTASVRQYSDRVLEADPARTLERGDAALRDLRAETRNLSGAALAENQTRIRDLEASLGRVRGFGALDPARMSPDQIRGVNELRAHTMAESTTNAWGDNHVRFGVSRQDQLARAHHFNRDFEAAFDRGATSLHGALADVSRTSGARQTGFNNDRQESTASQNFSNLANSWNTRDNGRVDRRILVADHGDFSGDTREFVTTMQNRFGLSLGNDENGRPRTLDSVMTALQRGETVQAGNFIFTRPQNQAQLERAFGDLASFRGERAVYVNGHGDALGFDSRRDNQGQRGLEGNRASGAESSIGRINVGRNFWVDQSRRLDGNAGSGAIPWIFDTCHSSPMLSQRDDGRPNRFFG